MKLSVYLVTSLVNGAKNPECSNNEASFACENDCEVENTNCLISCQQDSVCLSECSRSFAACLEKCPCYGNCYHGCPCPGNDYCDASDGFKGKLLCNQSTQQQLIVDDS